MSAANVELVRSIYGAWAEGRSARAFIAEDVEYVNPPDAIEPGVLRGRKSFARIRDAYDDVRVVPERYVEAGDDDVVVIAKLQVGTRGLTRRPPRATSGPCATARRSASAGSTTRRGARRRGAPTRAGA